jgi:hypothetical protein
MKPKLFVLALAAMAFYIQSCDHLDQDHPELNDGLLSCQTSDPMAELQWLADLDKQYEEQSYMYRIRIVEYEKSGYFMIENPESSSPMSTIFDCQGNAVLETNLRGVHYNDFIKNIRTVKTLKSKNWP